MPPKKKTIGIKYCCVVGCHNNLRTPGVKLYAFPKRNPEQSELWVIAVCRKNPDGAPWKPSNVSVICSAHFLNGAKSSTRGHPSYVPSIFPADHQKQVSDADLERFLRANKTAASGPTVPKEEEEETEDVPDQEPNSEPEEEEQPEDVPEQEPIPGPVCSSRKNQATQTMGSCDVGTMTVAESWMLDRISRSERGFKSWTGIPKKFFNVLLDLLGEGLVSSDATAREDKLLLFLIKLKTDLTFVVISSLFSISHEQTSEYFVNVLDLMYAKAQNLIFWPTRPQVQALMPHFFKTSHPNTRVIIGATEIKCEKPTTVEQQIGMYSDKKGTFTMKLLIGIIPSGEVTFFSPAYGGCTTNAQLVGESGLLELLEPNDIVMAGKGLPKIVPDVNKKGCFVVLPSPSRKNQQFTSTETEAGYKFANASVERAIARLKYFKILRFFTLNLFPHVNKIFTVICFIYNNFPHLVQED